MDITILAIGKLKERGLLELEADYLRRLSSSFISTRIEELPSSSRISSDPAVIVKRDCETLLNRLPRGSAAIALDERGSQLSSCGLAEMMQSEITNGRKELFFIIGGAYGFGNEVAARAYKSLSLSKMTLPYQLARVILIEQLYRAHSILTNSPYHKG